MILFVLPYISFICVLYLYMFMGYLPEIKTLILSLKTYRYIILLDTINVDG